MFLDAELFKSPRFFQTGFFDYRPHFKDKSNTRYLQQESCHAPAIHKSWPRGLLRRLKDLCSSPHYYRAAIKVFRARLLSDFIATPVQPHRSLQKVADAAHREFWITLPYHPDLYRIGVSKSFALIADRWKGILCSALQGDFSIGIAWSLSFPSISNFLRGQFKI